MNKYRRFIIKDDYNYEIANNSKWCVEVPCTDTKIVSSDLIAVEYKALEDYKEQCEAMAEALNRINDLPCYEIKYTPTPAKKHQTIFSVIDDQREALQKYQEFKDKK